MSYTYSHLEDFILKVYQNIDFLYPYQLNPFAIADALNIGLYPISERSQALRFGGRDYIFINSDLTTFERFEVFGHELAHLQLHVGNQASMPSNFQAYQEWQAERFSLHFCIPTFMLRKLNLPNDPKMAVYKISKLFGVTHKFAEKRLNMYKMKVLDLEIHTYPIY